jgi:hypothetical protein
MHPDRDRLLRMIEIGKMGNSGRAVMQHLLKDIDDRAGDSADLARCITELDTRYGYWWRYEPAAHHPTAMINSMIQLAKILAHVEAGNSGRTYQVGRAAATPTPSTACSPSCPKSDKRAAEGRRDLPHSKARAAAKK